MPLPWQPLLLPSNELLHYIGPFLLHWMPEVTKLAKPVDFLSLLINFVHYNATYLDEEVLVGLVQ